MDLETKTTMENANGVTTMAVMTTQPKPEPEMQNGDDRTRPTTQGERLTTTETAGQPAEKWRPDTQKLNGEAPAGERPKWPDSSWSGRTGAREPEWLDNNRSGWTGRIVAKQQPTTGKIPIR